MNVQVLYTTKSKHARVIAEEMARWVKTYAKSISDYHDDQVVDLMVIGFDDTLIKEHELKMFIQSLNRSQVKNIALFNSFVLNNKKMARVIQLCQKQDLPLMREQYSWKLTIKNTRLQDQHIVNEARLYIEDMVHIVQNYY